ncbi:MAG: hypothetical protein QY332_06440 [Anaerolineales bacterium]|nr:MAG: hypothetical protein QY332_06440 [Anaerolineales bacterium]
MGIDLTLTPLYRNNGREITSLPGLLALTPPANATRVRSQERLVVYLLLAGNAVFSTSEYLQVAQGAADVFYQTSGSLTSALRAATETVNKNLLERNMTTSGIGQYVNGWLTLAALREAQLTLSMSGLMHVYWFGKNETRHIHEPSSSGKGLGISQNTTMYYAQAKLSAGDRMLFFGRAPSAWDGTLNDPRPSSLEAMRRRLSTLTHDDLNAVLLQATDGTGGLNLLKGSAEIQEGKKEDETPHLDPTSSLPRRAGTEPTPESPVTSPAHVLQPSAYAIPPQQEEPLPPGQPTSMRHLPGNTVPREFPASIPRAAPKPQTISDDPAQNESPESNGAENVDAEKMEEPEAPREPSARTRQTAKMIAGGIQASRRLGDTAGERLRNFLPRLLPNTNEGGTSSMPSSALMMFLAILIPLVVVTIASVVYLRYGRSEQYDTYLRQAQQTRDQAVLLGNPVEQRIAWENVLQNVDRAEAHRQTSDTINLRKEANENRDTLLGIVRIQFNPAFSTKLNINASRMAAGETDLFLLNPANGEVLRAFPASGGRGFQLDATFNCRPGAYGNITVGPLVDILALPGLTSNRAVVLGIDASGNLLYCTPGEVAQAVRLPTPDTNWGRVTAFRMENGNLYVLDAPSRAVWVYNGKDGSYVDRPTFFFSKQTPTQDVIDFVIAGDELYMLHADGRVSNCTYSRVDTNSSQCQDPLPMVNPFKAYEGIDLFGNAHFIKVMRAVLPDQSILLLDADSQSVMRFSPRLLELQNLIQPTLGENNPIPLRPASAVAVSPNHVLYLAVDGQVYFALNMP